MSEGRRRYVNEGLTEGGEIRLRTAAAMGVCPLHGTRIGPRRVWCGKGEQTAEGAISCYWAFHLKFGRIKDWKNTRAQALLRDGGKCVECRSRATEVDHVIEIQDGGAEFELSNLQSLCHRCHVAKTNTRRFWREHRGQTVLPLPEGSRSEGP